MHELVLNHSGCFHRGGFLPALIRFYCHSLLLSLSHSLSAFMARLSFIALLLCVFCQRYICQTMLAGFFFNLRQKCSYHFGVLEKLRITMATAVSVNREYKARALIISSTIFRFNSMCVCVGAGRFSVTSISKASKSSFCDIISTPYNCSLHQSEWSALVFQCRFKMDEAEKYQQRLQAIAVSNKTEHLRILT